MPANRCTVCGNENERSDGIFWAMDDDLISGWFLNGERCKAILKFLCGPFLNVMIDIYCVTVLYMFLYFRVHIFMPCVQFWSLFKWFQCSCGFSCWCAMMDQRHWDGAVLPSKSAKFLYAWKVMEMKMEIVLFAYNYYLYIHWTISFILHTSVVQLSVANLVNTVYHLNYQPKCIDVLYQTYTYESCTW